MREGKKYGNQLGWMAAMRIRGTETLQEYRSRMSAHHQINWMRYALAFNRLRADASSSSVESALSCASSASECSRLPLGSCRKLKLRAKIEGQNGSAFTWVNSTFFADNLPTKVCFTDRTRSKMMSGSKTEVCCLSFFFCRQASIRG